MRKDKYRNCRVLVLLSSFLLMGTAGVAATHNENQWGPRYQEFSDSEEVFANLNVGGPKDTEKNAFFLDLGTNSRRGVTCHQASDAPSVTPPQIRNRFNATNATDAIFGSNAGSGCPTRDVSRERARRSACELLLTEGLIRIEQQVPVNAAFTILDNDNPYGRNNASAIFAYRRPLAATNTPYLTLSTVATITQDRSAPPNTGPEVKWLSVFVGNWAAEGELKPGPMGPGGKMPITRSCDWTYDGIGLLCREIDTIPGMGKVSHVILISYDAHAGDYVLFNASNLGHVWICQGTVNGDTWIWTGQHTMDGETMYLRMTQRWTSKDTFDFKDESGPAADSMTVSTDGKGTRVKTHAGDATPK